MENDNTKRFLKLIEDGIRTNWDKPVFSDYDGNALLFKDFAVRIAKLHIIFDTLHLEKGDKVALCGRNCTNWAVTFFASMSYGAVVTTILHDFDGDSVQNIVNHCDAKVFFVAEHVWEKVDPIKIPKVETIITIDDYSILRSRTEKLNQVTNDIDVIFAEKYPNFTIDDLKFHVEDPEEVALINYTSGTTSKPKGVMIPYRSLWSNTLFAKEAIEFVSPGDGLVSMLPMAHMYGLAFEILLSVAKGCHVHFLTRLPSPHIIMNAFAKVQPTLIIAVPLIIEKIITAKVMPELQKQPTKTLLKIPFVKDKIYAKIREKLINVFGGKVVEVVIGGAALDPEVGNFLKLIKFPYTVGYGMTECGPLIAYDYWETYRAASCGKPVDRMEVKVDSADPENTVGELIVKGANTMLGYYKNEEATSAVLSPDGWLRTGDLVTQDKEGYIYIKGRSKTMILGPSGQNIYPEEIEQLLNNVHFIAESLIVERNGKIHALIYPDQEVIKLHPNNLSVEDTLKLEIDEVNKRLPKYCQITDFTVRDEEFEKTPKRSIKRFLYK